MKYAGCIGIIIIVLGLFFLSTSAYIIKKHEQAVITQFGDPKREVIRPGLYFRVPFIQKVTRLEKRILPWDGFPENMPTLDKKNIHVDAFARWRIVEPLTFYKRARTINGGQKLLDDLVDSAVREVVADHDLIEMIRSTNRELEYTTEELEEEQQARAVSIIRGRSELEEQIRETATLGLQDAGIELVDVHIKRINYVESVRQDVNERMKSERLRIASLYRSQAREQQERIRGETEKELAQIRGEAESKSAEIRGMADAEVIRIYAEAIEADPEFFSFLRQLEAYKKSLTGKTRLILTTDNPFFEEFNAPGLNAPGGASSDSKPIPSEQ